MNKDMATQAMSKEQLENIINDMFINESTPLVGVIRATLNIASVVYSNAGDETKESCLRHWNNSLASWLLMIKEQ